MGDMPQEAYFHHSATPSLHHSTAPPSAGFRYPAGPVPCYYAAMALDATARRRWFGALALLAALAILIGGETLLKGKLGGLGFMFYWLVCLVFTCLAIVIAFLDARALRRQTRQTQDDLFDATLKQIETEAKARRGRPDRRRRGS